MSTKNTKSTKQAAEDLLHHMTEEELLALNKTVVSLIKNRRRWEGAEQATLYSVGEIVEFRNRQNIWEKARVERTNLTTLSVFVEARVGGRPERWRVPYRFIRKPE